MRIRDLWRRITEPPKTLPEEVLAVLRAKVEKEYPDIVMERVVVTMRPDLWGALGGPAPGNSLEIDNHLFEIVLDNSIPEVRREDGSYESAIYLAAVAALPHGAPA